MPVFAFLDGATVFLADGATEGETDGFEGATEGGKDGSEGETEGENDGSIVEGKMVGALVVARV